MAALRKTKIVCTLGPATEDDAVLREMILSGMNVVRLNFSHGSYEGHARNIRRVRALCQELHTPIGIMLDTKSFILRTGVRTVEAAAFLRRMGADTVAVRKLFASSMESYQERSRLVSAAEVYRGCAISCTSGANVEGIRVVAPQAADDLLGISGVDASFVLYEQDGAVNISARSMGAINVQLILEGMGGGGHQTMAGAQIKDITLEDCRQQLLVAIDRYYEENPKGGKDA